MTFVDKSTKYVAMSEQKSKNKRPLRQIVGFSLAPDLAREVKAEAAQRGMSLRKLFEEVWQLYLADKKRGKKS